MSSGVSNNEMQDLLTLALADEKFCKELFQFWTPDIKRVPMHVWLRLLNEMRDVLVQKSSGCWVWYHRQLKETSENHLFIPEEIAKFREYLGLYFSDQIDPEVQQKQLITRQPITLNEELVWYSSCLINTRRCIEGSCHLVEGGLLKQACRELCSLENVYARICSGEGFEVVRYLYLLREKMLAGGYDETCFMWFCCHEEATTVYHYLRWVQQDMNRLIMNGGLRTLISPREQPLVSQVFKDAATLLQRLRRNSSKEILYFGRTLGRNASEFSACVMNLQGHSNSVTSVCLSPDGRQIVSGLSDNTVKIWDATSGACVST